ncbi:GAF domain-containing protein [Chiayiivirga flava]|uniref:Light-regulated signal transduction histidine kinase (Bacteriophytochrome) n=1 Tax=Chiayiivirga flava TaxID=659595 RepID=A0A7W8G1L9_9GAMM|nr:GAF domain-containing protein [Chiayiivirga flava]MBB5209559.1 light-regulated signal transduction histidine kinase (bacteriophytochrome) [Chiayiivirga flava]
MTDPVATPMSLDECAREPIHIPGSIQPHGILLVVDAATQTIVQASDNAAALLGIAQAQLADLPWRDAVAIARDPSAAAAERPLHLAWASASFPANPDAAPHVGCWHLYDTRWLLEIEPDAADDAPSRDDAYPIVRRVEDDGTVQHAAERVAAAFKSLLGYDRVMVYRFDRDWHGEVIAEVREPQLEPYLGLHYPATDIPAQARALYLRNRVRAIADIGYRAAALVPVLDPHTGQPTDLSDVSLRSVSPVHIEYLSNMGVTATLVTSIVVQQKLWGLVSCHHYAQRACDRRMRAVADDLTRALAARIGALEQLDAVWAESRLLTTREKLIARFNQAETIDTALLRNYAHELLEVVEADGVALLDGDVHARYGTLPDDGDLLAIRRRIVESGGTGMQRDLAGVLYTDTLGGVFPDLAHLAARAAGVLYIPLDANARSAILWTRVEQVQTVKWGGNPHLAKLQAYPGARLSPRQSFSLWQETVKGRARAWDPIHVESARSLRVLVELMDRKHFQLESGVLAATLDRLDAPLFLLQAQPGGGAVQVTYINDAFIEQTGFHTPSDVTRAWNLDSTAVQMRLALAQPFQLAANRDVGRQRQRLDLKLQPIAAGDGGRRWMALLEPSLLGAEPG